MHVPAGPAAFVRKEELLPEMADFTSFTTSFCRGERRGYDLVHANFFMSGPQDRADIVTLYGGEPGKITVIPCGFTPADFWPIARKFARKTLGLGPDQRVVLHLGRLVPRKGIENAIRGVAHLKRQFGVEPKLSIVGGNSDIPDPDLYRDPKLGRQLCRRAARRARGLFTWNAVAESVAALYDDVYAGRAPGGSGVAAAA
jgi:glycosyltransferase involved in cell wall biosynthesis